VSGRADALRRSSPPWWSNQEGIIAKRKSDPYRRGVKWWKIKNRAYSQTEERRELLNRTGRAVTKLREYPANLRVGFDSSDRQNPE
jgi:hypothetical protein